MPAQQPERNRTIETLWGKAQKALGSDYPELLSLFRHWHTLCYMPAQESQIHGLIMHNEVVAGLSKITKQQPYWRAIDRLTDHPPSPRWKLACAKLLAAFQDHWAEVASDKDTIREDALAALQLVVLGIPYTLDSDEWTDEIGQIFHDHHLPSVFTDLLIPMILVVVLPNPLA